jgi:hypothetical protein
LHARVQESEREALLKGEKIFLYKLHTDSLLAKVRVVEPRSIAASSPGRWHGVWLRRVLETRNRSRYERETLRHLNRGESVLCCKKGALKSPSCYQSHSHRERFLVVILVVILLNSLYPYLHLRPPTTLATLALRVTRRFRHIPRMMPILLRTIQYTIYSASNCSRSIGRTS